MANGRIDVYFHAGEGGESNEIGGQDSEKEATTPKMNKNDIARSAVTSMAINYGKKAMTYGLSIYGDLTGDYIKQRQIEGLIDAAGTAAMMAQFPLGTIAGAFSIATKTASYFINAEKQNRQTALLKERAGSETINNSEVD